MLSKCLHFKMLLLEIKMKALVQKIMSSTVNRLPFPFLLKIRCNPFFFQFLIAMKVVHFDYTNLRSLCPTCLSHHYTRAFCCDNFFHRHCNLQQEVVVASEQCMDGQGGEGFYSFLADIFVIKKLFEGILDIETLKNWGAKT